VEQRNGLIEAIKVALIRDIFFFEEIESTVESLAQFEPSPMQRVIRRCAELHVQHIAESGDPFEYGSARPLDFGHWAAHKLEQMSHVVISHGKAVAMGIALNRLYSQKSGMLSAPATERILALIQKLGFAIHDPLMSPSGTPGGCPLIEGLNEFREHLGGKLTIMLLAAIGQGVEVHEIDIALMGESIFDLAHRSSPQLV
jgi:3-dehydroquinate synthase